MNKCKPQLKRPYISFDFLLQFYICTVTVLLAFQSWSHHNSKAALHLEVKLNTSLFVICPGALRTRHYFQQISKQYNNKDTHSLAHKGDHMQFFIYLQHPQAHQMLVASFCDVAQPLSPQITSWPAVFPQLTKCSLQAGDSSS